MTSHDRMLELLAVFSETKLSFSLEEAVKITGTSKPTAYRYIQSLTRAGLLAPASGDRYILGSRIVELEHLVRANDPLMRSAHGPMLEASRLTGLNVMLCGYYGDRVMCLDMVWPDDRTASFYQRGRPMPLLYGAMAKTILAHFSAYQMRQLYLRYAEEIAASGFASDWEEFRKALSVIRQQGYAITDSEVFDNMVGVAAPVFANGKRILGSVVWAISGEKYRSLDSAQLVEQIKVLSQTITDAIRLREEDGSEGATGGGLAARPRFSKDR